MVWDLYDGVRSGIANYGNTPHYFVSVFENEYTDKFELYPVDDAFLKLAKEQWKIYRDWEILFHTGKEQLNTHPGHGGINYRYDEIEAILNKKIRSLVKLKTLYHAEFRVLPNQEHLPKGVLKEVEVCWHEIT